MPEAAPVPGLPTNQATVGNLLSLYDEGVKSNPFNILPEGSYEFEVVSAKADESKGEISIQYSVTGGEAGVTLIGTRFSAGKLRSTGDDEEKARSIFAQNIQSLGFSREDVATLGTLTNLAAALVGRTYRAKVTTRTYNSKQYNQIGIGAFELLSSTPVAAPGIPTTAPALADAAVDAMPEPTKRSIVQEVLPLPAGPPPPPVTPPVHVGYAVQQAVETDVDATPPF
jgi:hypothetical protein